MIRMMSLSVVSMFLAGSAAASPRSEMSAEYSGLPDAEMQACGGVSDYDLKNGPFVRTEEITSVVPLMVEEYPRSNPPLRRTVGAVVTIRARPGLTAEWLQRLVNCDLAHNSALRRSVAEMPNSPLGFRGATAHVRSTGDGFAVEIRSNEPETARQILTTAQRLYQQRQLAAQKSASAAAPREPRH
jgi:hypothetical protein